MTEMQMLMGMFGLLWATMLVGFGWGIRILGEIKAGIAMIKADLTTIKTEIMAIEQCLERLEARVVAPR